MLIRFAGLAITLFWIVMNALLWRSEFKGASELGAPVPLATVWQKILTAPDDSALGVFQDDHRIGFCRWSANVGAEAATGKSATEELPEGQIKQLAGYTVDLEGNLALNDEGIRLRFTLHLLVDTNQAWREVNARVVVRPSVWELHASALNETVTFKGESAADKWERHYTFADLRNPQLLLRDFGAGALAAWFTGQNNLLPSLKGISLAVPWTARNDWLKLGRSQIRVYRLEARLLDRFRIVIFVSRLGEILQVELPDNIRLLNEALNF